MRITCILILLILFGVTSYAQNDCPDAIIVCGDANYFDLEAEGEGQNQELGPNACNSEEHNSIWLKIQINQGGTLGFILTPEQNAMEIDFDFWLFGPIDECGIIGTAIRCSTTNPLQAGINYITTGMNATETDTSEGPGPDGNAFVNWITVQNNEFYYLVIDRPHGFGNFSMEWTGTATFHAIPVFLNPDNIPLDIAQCDKDGLNDESTAFDLTVYESMFIGNQNPVAVTYHDDLNGSTTGQDPILDPEAYHNITNPQTIYLRMTNTVTGCYSTHTFNIEVTPPMTTGIPVDILLCDNDGNGIQEFNLSQNDTNVRSTNPASTIVTYYTSPDDALSGTNAVGPLFTNTVPYQQTLWARLEDTDGCFSYDFYPFDVIVQPLPFFNNPSGISLDLTHCDNDGINDNANVFDLTTHAGMLTNSQDNVAITYYLTPIDAETGNNSITNPQAYVNISDPQVIYMRILNAVTGCYDTLPFTINIERIPTGIPNNLALCDINEDGFREFDLFENNDPVLGLETGTVTFHNTEDDARNGINPISTNYTNAVAYTTETIWARLQKDFGPCVGYGVVPFTISIIPLPEIENPDNIPFDMVKCDLDGVMDDSTEFDLTVNELVMIGDQASVSISYHISDLDAESGDSPIINPTAYANTVNPQTIYVRLFDTATQCYQTGSFNLSILPRPEIAPQPPLLVCDINNDGHAEFNLNPVIQQITADLGTVTVTIHVTADDALFGVNAIQDTGDYQNINADTQTLYIRAESALACIDVETIQLIVNPVPEATTPTFYPLCDDGTNDTDGRATFDLTTKAAEIYGNIDPAQFSLAFFESLTAAQAGTPAIANPLSYNSATRTVYARVTNNVTGCFDIVYFDLIVNPLPVLITNEGTYVLCDQTAPIDDEKEVFDLTTQIPNYVASQDGIAISFHHSFDDATANTNAIANPAAYQNQEPGVETVFIRFTIEATGCYRIGFLDVRVPPLPIILEPTQDELTVCDTNGEGIGEFNLEALVTEMMNGEPGLTLTFHETQEDAIDGVNAIPNPENYVNPTPGLQPIYVRVVHAEYDCFNTFMLTLIVEPAPQAPALEDITLCDDQDNNGQDNRRLVDLTVQTPIIEAALGLDEPTQLIVEYYTTQAAADAGTGRIINPGAFMGTDGQQIWVRVESPTTECYSLSDFELHFNQPHALTRPAVYSICNEELPNDGVAEFDLTTRDNEILGAAGQGQGYTVNYYDGDPKNGGILIADPSHYNNPAGPPVVNPKTLYVEVITTEGCKSYTTLTVKVLALPVPNFNPTALQVCDDNNSPDGIEEFDLTLADSQIRNNGSNYILSYHTTYADADAPMAGLNPIADPTAYESATGEVYVRVELNTNNPAEERCHQVVTLGLIVNPLPPVNNMNVYPICEQNTDGEADFNIQEFVNNELTKQGVNPADYDVDFFTDAALATPAIPVNAYHVTGGSATIYVRVVDLVTGCRIVKPLQLVVEEFATATQPADSVLEECDTDGSNDGFFVFDLTQVEAEVLGTQNPAHYTVSYHVSLADAEEGDNPIADPTFFANTQVDTQPVWIRVVNNTSVGECDAIVQIDVLVERLPEPVIAGGTICVDKSTGAVVRPLLIDTGLTSGTFVWIYTDGDGVTTTLPETGPSILAQAPGQYNVVATSPAGCVSDPIAAVTVLQSGPAVKVDRGYYVTNYFSDNQNITVTIDGYGVYEYSLDEGPWQTSNVFDNVSPGTHTVRVRDTNPDACDELVITDASIVDYPNFFTPNGDGFRDTWNVIGLNQPDAKIYIFDRYGKLLKQISAVGEGWDGTFNGEQLPSTDYWFTVTYGEFNGTETLVKEFRAHFSLKR